MHNLRSVVWVLGMLGFGCGSSDGSFPRLVVAEDVLGGKWIAVIADDPQERTKLDTDRFVYYEPGTVVVFDRDPREGDAVPQEVIRSDTERLGMFTHYGDQLCSIEYGTVICSIVVIEWGNQNADGTQSGWEVFEMRLGDPPVPVGVPDQNGYQWWEIEVPTTLLDLVFEDAVLRAGVEVAIDSWYGPEGAWFVSGTGDFIRRE